LFSKNGFVRIVILQALDTCISYDYYFLITLIRILLQYRKNMILIFARLILKKIIYRYIQMFSF